MWKVWQARWIKDSEQNRANLIWTGTRKREAYGQAKQLFRSHLENMAHHNIFGDCYDLDEKNFYMGVYKDNEKIYSIQYYVIMSPDTPVPQWAEGIESKSI